jgi:DNA (cytosine-5)-methyltransferase 1
MAANGGVVDYDKAKANRNQISLAAQIKKFLPTPVARDFKGDLGRKDNVSAQVKMNWAQFQPAIRRWETVTGRTAPEPLLPDTKLNPAFTEWMMGLPEGWITDIDISWSQQIKACGNGVVPQQALLALSKLT